MSRLFYPFAEELDTNFAIMAAAAGTVTLSSRGSSSTEAAMQATSKIGPHRMLPQYPIALAHANKILEPHAPNKMNAKVPGKVFFL